MKPTATLKDINLLQKLKYNNWLKFREVDQIAIAKTLEADVEIMKCLNLMDYSLLLCVEDNPDYVQGMQDGTIGTRNRDTNLVDFTRGQSAINSVSD
mmetsp:Transcript_64258/g.88881  ORF Transcript_64258/g.88881 Transcript_64258/m.88881 type:complete len:97 (+) Transcript_64258:343-633(+)